MPALDGLRAVAVGGVLLFHGEVSWAGGGFLGVDAFFVLSGFLITSLLLAEWRGTGTITLGAFWARRARRLLPALFLVLAAVAVYASVTALPIELDRIRRDGFSSLGYVANWQFVASGDSYFEQFATPSPLRHMWSLAIEEQFYLAWPLIVFGILKWRRGSTRALATATAAMIAGSVALMALLYQPGSDPSRVYYGTDTRAQSILVGAALAIFLSRREPVRRGVPRRALDLSALGAGIVLLYWWGTVSERTEWLYRGGFLLEASLVALVIASITQPRPGLVGRLLSARALRWVGMISYGLYLWHWPVYVVMSEERMGESGAALLLERLVVTFGLASLSYYLVEMPIRHGAVRGWRVRALAPATAAGLCVALLAATTGSTAPPFRDLAAAEVAAAPAPVNVAAPEATRVMIVGDSVASTLAPGVDRIAPSYGMVVWDVSIPGCGLAQDVGERYTEGWEPQHPKCVPGWRERWPRQLAEFQPDVVVALLGAQDTFDRRIDGRDFAFDTAAGDDLARTELQEAVAVLSSSGARVIFLTTPYYRMGWPQHVRQDRSLYNPTWIDRWNTHLSAVATSNAGVVTLLDLNAVLDPDGRWTDTVDGVRVRDIDKMHLTAAGADLAAAWLAPEIKRLGRAGTGPVSTTNAGVAPPPP